MLNFFLRTEKLQKSETLNLVNRDLSGQTRPEATLPTEQNGLPAIITKNANLNEFEEESPKERKVPILPPGFVPDNAGSEYCDDSLTEAHVADPPTKEIEPSAIATSKQPDKPITVSVYENESAKYITQTSSQNEDGFLRYPTIQINNEDVEVRAVKDSGSGDSEGPSFSEVANEITENTADDDKTVRSGFIDI